MVLEFLQGFVMILYYIYYYYQKPLFAKRFSEEGGTVAEQRASYVMSFILFDCNNKTVMMT